VIDETSSQPAWSLAASLRLFADLDAAGQARSFVRDFCQSSSFSSEFCDVAVLLVGELVKNALVNGGQEPTVEIQRAGDGLRIGVHGSGPDIPPQRSSVERSKIMWFEIHAMEAR
jgi:anti-sigma regulatory factor (Ser/Thr protein kinase)